MRKIFSIIFMTLFAFCAYAGKLTNGINVEPDTVYELELEPAIESSWIVEMLDEKGRIPEDGLLNSDWQKPRDAYKSLPPPKRTMRFRTLPTTKRVAITVSSKSSENTKLKFEKVVDDNILSSRPDFEYDDYSGFNEFSKSAIQGSDAYTLTSSARGYFISDFIPMKKDAEYKLDKSKVRTNFSIMYYDADKNYLRQTGARETIHCDGSFGYIRLFFGGDSKLSGLSMKQTKGDKTPTLPREFDMAKVSGSLVANGKPAASIILNGAQSDLRERFAAYELRRWVKAVTGAELPIFESDKNVEGTKIYIGHAFAGKQFSSSLKKLEDSEGYAFVPRDGNFYIFGANSKGTLFGTWRFIEENLDLIWSRPLDYGTIFEPLKNAKIVSKARLDIPSFKMRSWSMPGGVQNNEITNLYYARNGANPGLTVIGYRPDHYLARMYARSIRVGGGFMYGYLGKYKETNPEFFPLTDGKRKLTNHAQPCFTNKLSVETIVKEARIHMDTAPDDNVYLDCGNEDTWVCCECDTCLAPIKLPDGTTLEAKSKFSDKDPLFRSTQLYMFLNAVAEGLEKEYPDTKITTLAYIFSAEYPAVPIHKNVLSLFAPYPTHNMRFPLRDSHSRGTAAGRTWAERFDDWCKGESPLAFYEYLGNAYFNAMADATAENLRDLKHKAKNPYGINSEALQDFDQSLYGIGNFKQMWDVNSMNMWVITRLMWDPDQNVDELRKEFIRKAYREAAPQMTEFWNIIIKNWNDPALKYSENCHSGRGGVFKRYIVDTGDEKRLRTLLVEAEKAAKNPGSKKLIQDIIKSFDGWANELGRIIVPEISESTTEAMNINSPHWEKAVTLDDFKLPRQYNVKAEERKKASYPTRVSFMCDDKTLYVKFSCDVPENYPFRRISDFRGTFPPGEHAEIQFQVKGIMYLFAVSPEGHFYAAKNWDPMTDTAMYKYKVSTEKGKWEAVLAIPFAELGFKKDEALKYPLETVLSRMHSYPLMKKITPEPEESTYKGVVPHGQHVWTPLTFE